MKLKWKWKPWMATFSFLFLTSPGMGMTKETEVLLEKALKQSEQELKSLQQAHTKARRSKNVIAKKESKDEPTAGVR